MKTFQFYIWKPSSNVYSDTIGTCDKNTYTDTWLVYDESKGVITKTCELTFLDVRAYIFKNNPIEVRGRRTRIDIITAAPTNLSDFPEIENIEYDISLLVTGFKFVNLKKRDILFIRSEESSDKSDTESLYVDIFFKKIFDQPVERVPPNLEKRRRGLISQEHWEITPVNRREYLKNIQISETQILNELKSKYTGIEFITGFTPYYTYSVVPACGRSFEELYEDCIEIENDHRESDFLDLGLYT